MTGKLHMEGSQRLALEKRMTYEAVESLRRRFGRMAGADMLTPHEFNQLTGHLDVIKETVSGAEVDDATVDV